VWTTLGSVLTHLVDCVNDTPDFADYDTGLIGLKSTNVRPYCLDLARRWFMTPEDFNRWNRRERPQEGDILLTREAPVGFACIVPQGLNLCITQRLMLLRPDDEIILSKVLLHYLNSPIFQKQVEESCRGLTTPHIRVQDAPHFLLPLPPLSEQDRIVAELDAIQAQFHALRHAQKETAAELDAMLPAILDRAFRGELRA
ncbi:MAG: restriction endonuclease subunit S, partial [Gammaproteobacteria bacterium]